VRRLNSLSVRESLSTFVETELGPSDMVYRDVAAPAGVFAADDAQSHGGGTGRSGFLGRKYDYQPRNESSGSTRASLRKSVEQSPEPSLDDRHPQAWREYLPLDFVSRLIVVLAPQESPNGLCHRRAIARHPQRRHRLERRHHGNHVGGSELGLNESRERLAYRQAVETAHVIVVQEDRKQPHVVSRSFQFLV